MKWAWFVGLVIGSGLFCYCRDDRATVLHVGFLRERAIGSVIWGNGRPKRFRTGLAVVLFMVRTRERVISTQVLYQTRTFFGVLKVKACN